MYWIATSPRLSRGRSTPAMRAIAAPFSGSLALPLLVARVLADDAHAPRAPHHLAVLAPHLDRRSDFHGESFRAISPLVSSRPGAFVTRPPFISDYLNRYVIRTRVRSSGESSTLTLSPG